MGRCSQGGGVGCWLRRGGACVGGARAGVWTKGRGGQEPMGGGGGGLTRIMRAMVRPRRTSMERTRAGAAAGNKTWVIGAGWVPGIGAPEIGELVAGLAAGGMVIHDRSSRTGVGKFCELKVAVEKRIS